MALCEAVFNDTRMSAIARLDLKMDELGKRGEDCSRFSHLKKERVELDVDVD